MPRPAAYDDHLAYIRDVSNEFAIHLINVTELCRELNTRWFEVTQRVFQSHNELLTRCAEAADKVS